MGDFMVAGGVILFCLGMIDLTVQGETRRGIIPELGAVPIGTPLVVGPAVLTISLMLVSVHGLVITLIGLSSLISSHCRHCIHLFRPF